MTDVDYDPYDPAVMTDPHPAYARLRARDPVHYLERYDTWALASFDAVWEACRDTASFTVTRGQTPSQVMLGEPSGHNTFAELDPPLHRLRRRVLAPEYTREAADDDEPAIRALARSVLATALGSGDEMDVYGDYASQVTARIAARKAGVPEHDGVMLRRMLDGMFHREPGQKGSSPENGEAAMQAFGYLFELVAAARRDPSSATGHLAAMLTAEVEGEPFTDEMIAAEMHTIMITGSETTEFSVCTAVERLAHHPDQLAELRADPGLVPWAFAEAVRWDHPTNMLCRSVARDVEIGGKQLTEGQGVLLLWASACRDETEYTQADTYDIHRRYERSLLFGHGQHKCIGEHLALRMGSVILGELLAVIADYEVDLAGAERLYGEFLKGYTRLPIRFARA